MNNIPYARQSISNDDIQAVIEVLKSDWLTQGPMVERFEKAVAEYCGAKYAVAVNSATSALHIACLAAGLGQGDTMWTSPNTFVASANCGRYCGANIDFVDINERTYNISIQELEEKLKKASQSDRLPKVVIPVHFAGQSCEMESIRKLTTSYGITLIEDASHAIGGKYKGKPVGACAFSDMTVFSFHPVKIITTGEGGMILTNRRDLYEQLILLRSHGITRNTELMNEDPCGPWYYEQLILGYNYRMTDIQAALGLSQLTQIDEFVRRRHEIAARYNERLKGLPLYLPWQAPDTYSAYHLYVITLKPDEINKNHRQIFNELRANGVGVNLHYIPVHTQPYYKQLGFRNDDFPTALAFYGQAISLPMYYNLSEAEQDRVVEVLKGVLQ
jgi:UDP-4-amino-4,6-dideoxy-N-acetyl-beta-L-altrosamine transaminase